MEAVKKETQDSLNRALAEIGKSAPAAEEKAAAKKQFEEMQEISNNMRREVAKVADWQKEIQTKMEAAQKSLQETEVKMKKIGTGGDAEKIKELRKEMETKLNLGELF